MLRKCTRGGNGVYLHRAGPGAMGQRRCLKGYDRASKLYSEKQRGTVLGSETISLISCHMTYKPPPGSPEPQDHVCTLQSCHGAVVAPLSEVPQEGYSVFSLFSLIKLHLASHPLTSSYSRTTVSSIFCAQDILFGPSVWGSVKRSQGRGFEGEVGRGLVKTRNISTPSTHLFFTKTCLRFLSPHLDGGCSM